MTACLLKLMVMTLTLVSFLAVSGLSSPQPDASPANQEPPEGGCLPCELFFRKLAITEENGKQTQIVRVQARGEPKSGTGIMFDWATAAVMRTCDYLQLLFGEKSCLMEATPGPEDDGHLPPRPVTHRMVFEPALGASNAKCPCETIERVSIVLSAVEKHTLPVSSDSCAFSHRRGIDMGTRTEGNRQSSACTFADGSGVKHSEDLWRCMHEANCDITDDWLQMVILRDPRPAVVSTFFHLRTFYRNRKVGTLEQFVAKELPIVCQWLAVRYTLFSGLLPHQSMQFWLNDAMADPLEWHYHWFDSLGLQLPHHVVNDAANRAAADDLGFKHKQIEQHPGERARTGTGVRKFEDEVGPEVLKTADAVLRVWLPSALLVKLRVEPEQIGM